MQGREDFRSKRAKTSGQESGTRGTGCGGPSSFQPKMAGLAPSSASALAPRVRNEQGSQHCIFLGSQSQGSVTPSNCYPLVVSVISLTPESAFWAQMVISNVVRWGIS